MNYVGMGVSESNLTPVIIVCGVVVTLLAVVAWKREKLIEFLKKHSKKNNNKEPESEAKETDGKKLESQETKRVSKPKTEPKKLKKKNK
jgi:FtsZ-interacting cell division protein ZipA